MNFKSTNDTIRISFMKKAKGGELGYIGQAVSTRYGKIDLAIDYRTEENRTYDLACSAHIPGDKDSSWVLMEEKVFCDFLQGSALARMTVFHEIGHIAFQDCLDPLKLEQRKKYVRDGTISEREVRADKFAADFLGVQLVIKALEKLKAEMRQKYSDEEYADEVEIVEQELALRIKELQM